MSKTQKSKSREWSRQCSANDQDQKYSEVNYREQMGREHGKAWGQRFLRDTQNPTILRTIWTLGECGAGVFVLHMNAGNEQQLNSIRWLRAGEQWISTESRWLRGEWWGRLWHFLFFGGRGVKQKEDCLLIMHKKTFRFFKNLFEFQKTILFFNGCMSSPFLQRYITPKGATGWMC